MFGTVKIGRICSLVVGVCNISTCVMVLYCVYVVIGLSSPLLLWFLWFQFVDCPSRFSLGLVAVFNFSVAIFLLQPADRFCYQEFMYPSLV